MVKEILTAICEIVIFSGLIRCLFLLDGITDNTDCINGIIDLSVFNKIKDHIQSKACKAKIWVFASLIAALLKSMCL